MTTLQTPGSLHGGGEKCSQLVFLLFYPSLTFSHFLFYFASKDKNNPRGFRQHRFIFTSQLAHQSSPLPPKPLCGVRPRHTFRTLTVTSSRWPITAGTPGRINIGLNHRRDWLPSKYRSAASGANMPACLLMPDRWQDVQFHCFPHLKKNTAQMLQNGVWLWSVRPYEKKRKTLHRQRTSCASWGRGCLGQESVSGQSNLYTGNQERFHRGCQMQFLCFLKHLVQYAWLERYSWSKYPLCEFKIGASTRPPLAILDFFKARHQSCCIRVQFKSRFSSQCQHKYT